MEQADRIWLAIGGCTLVLIRDHRLRKKLKEARKMIEILNLENEFLHAFAEGLTNPKTDKHEVLKNLSHQFGFLTKMKGA